VRLADPIPVLVVYLTATVKEDGEVVFHDDVYGRDQSVVALLDAPDVTHVARRSTRLRCPA
jgi:murein L,D-transpeptidase YcbB/YkuD